MRCMLERPPSVAWPSIRTSRSKAAVMKNKDIARTKEVAGAKANIFIVGPANPELSSLQSYVGSFGFNVVRCRSAGEVSRLSNSQSPAVCLLTLAADQRGATATISDLVDKLHCGLIVLAETGDASDRVIGLELGADDYLTKPFGMDELLARMRAALRHQLQVQGERPIFRTGDLSVDLVRRTVRVGEREVKLSPKEYDLLRVLVQHAGKVLTHRFLLKELWDELTDAQYLRVYVRQLRQKIEADPERPQFVLTETGIGYRLRAPD